MAAIGDAQRDLRRRARRPGRRGHMGNGGGRAEGSCRRHHPRANSADHGGRPGHGPRAGPLVRHGALRRGVCAPRPWQNTHGGHIALPHGLPQHPHRQLRPPGRMDVRPGRDRVVGHGEPDGQQRLGAVPHASRRSEGRHSADAMGPAGRDPHPGRRPSTSNVRLRRQPCGHDTRRRRPRSGDR